jgi:hypothetical protein
MTDQKKTVIETLLDNVDWKPEPGPGPGATVLPFVTHSGKMKMPMLDGLEIQVYQLSNGKRIIPDTEMERIFDAMGSSTPTKARCEGISPSGLRCDLAAPHRGLRHRHFVDGGDVTWDGTGDDWRKEPK